MLEVFALHPLDHILFVLFGLLLPIRTIRGQRKLKDLQFDYRMRITLYIANSIGLWLIALVVLGLWWWLARPFATLGLQWTAAAASFWSILTAGIFLLLYLADTGRDLLGEKGRQETENRLAGELSMLPRKFKAYLFFVLLAFSAGICEEIVFRGFFVSYFISLFGNNLTGQVLALLVPALIFGLVHTYQGKAAVFKIVGMAIIFGALFLYTGSIYLLIFLHTLVDLIGGSVGLFFPETESIPDLEADPSSGVLQEEE